MKRRQTAWGRLQHPQQRPEEGSKVRGWLELPVMEQPRKGLSFWSVTGKTLDVRSQGDQSHLAFLLKGPLSGVRPPWPDRDDVRYSIREGAAGSAF